MNPTNLINALKRALEANPAPSYFGPAKDDWRTEALDAIDEAEAACPACDESPCKAPCSFCGAPCSEDHRNCNPVSKWEEGSRYDGSLGTTDDVAKIWPDAHRSYATIQIGDGPVTDLDTYLAKTARVL